MIICNKWSSLSGVENGNVDRQCCLGRSGNLMMAAMEAAVLSKFKSVKHETVWRKERPEKIRGEKRELKVYRIYHVGMTQRQALYTFTFKGISLRSHIESNPCAKFELSEQPEFDQEIKFQPGKHTLWGPSDDFTEGQALVCRRHTVVFPPGVLDEAFKKLLQCDRRLSDVSLQPFPTHNSPLFCNQILDFSNNRSVVHGIIDKHLLPSSGSGEAIVFYHKMKGDYFRYLAEFKTDKDRKEAAEQSLKGYEA
ncbi:hypothetical protein L6452_00001 [Arctium lappa]|uniref:Uncharacterized protein n=1 Tax=Arctium lappa TaxID=4217 RepID=A0ACB9FD31_ARCLA|nr:hypothetical protein L6452_00001 [Arctium lappa]